MSTLYAEGATTVEGYRLATNDQTSAASAVSAALIEAEELLAEELRRRLVAESRSGTFRLYADGRVYPDAWPITDGGTLQIEDTRTLVGAVPDASPFVGIIRSSSSPPRATVSWIGGFTGPSGAYPLPPSLERAIYDLAGAAISFSDVPAGATSLSLGDASISFGTPSSGLDSMVPGLSVRIAKYRNRWV